MRKLITDMHTDQGDVIEPIATDGSIEQKLSYCSFTQQYLVIILIIMGVLNGCVSIISFIHIPSSIPFFFMLDT